LGKEQRINFTLSTPPTKQRWYLPTPIKIPDMFPEQQRQNERRYKKEHSSRIVLTEKKKEGKKHVLPDSPCVTENFLHSYDIYGKPYIQINHICRTVGICCTSEQN